MRDCFRFGVLVYLWSAVFIVGALACCGCEFEDSAPADGAAAIVASAPFSSVAVQSCDDFGKAILPWVATPTVPSITPATYGIRMIAPTDFDPFFGASFLVPGGRLVWVVWIYHWYDGDHMGSIGRMSGGTTCMWYDPL